MDSETGRSDLKYRRIVVKLSGEALAGEDRAPTLFLVAESSSEGTIGAILNDPSRACVWPVKDCEDATRALTACFPRSGPVTLGDAKRLWYAQACKTVADDQAAAVKAAMDSKQPHPAPLPLPAPPIASPHPRQTSSHPRTRAFRKAGSHSGGPIATPTTRPSGAELRHWRARPRAACEEPSRT